MKKRLVCLFETSRHQSPSDAASHPRRTEGSSKNERMGERSGMHENGERRSEKDVGAGRIREREEGVNKFPY